MKSFRNLLLESINISEGSMISKGSMIFEGEINSEKEFREFAKKKFEEVFGDDLDEKRMKFTINGFLKDNKKDVDEGNWAELVGKFNQSFTK